MNDLVKELRDDVKFGNPEWHGWCLKLAHAAADEIERLRADIERLAAVIARPPVHLVKLTDTGWTIQHPATCEDLFDCEHTVVAEMWDGNPAGDATGVFMMNRDGTVEPWLEPEPEPEPAR